MKKILFAASTLSHIENFHIPYLEQFKKQGFIVHVMGKPNNKSDILYADEIIPIPFKKNMFSVRNFVLIFKIAKLIRANNYDIISIHTSLAAFFIRLGIMLSFKKTKLVINTVHGYLFDDKSPLLKKSMLLLAEKLTKCVTNIVIVMNSFDYAIAKKHKLYKDNIYLINGMGINSSQFPSISAKAKISLRQEYEFSEDDFLLVYAAEFSKRKNQKFLLDAIHSLLNDNFKNIKLLLLGDGILFDELKFYAQKLDISKNVIFIGYTRNTCEYYQMSDICVSSSRSEGLPFNIMEAMSVGLPVIASRVKGHTDLVVTNENGFLFNYNDIDEFSNYIISLYKDKKLCHELGIKSKELSRKYSLDAVFPNVLYIINKEYEKHL